MVYYTIHGSYGIFIFIFPVLSLNMIFEKICVKYRVATITAGMQSSSLKQARSLQRSSATVAQLDGIRLGEFHHKVYSVMGS